MSMVCRVHNSKGIENSEKESRDSANHFRYCLLEKKNSIFAMNVKWIVRKWMAFCVSVDCGEDLMVSFIRFRIQWRAHRSSTVEVSLDNE